MFQQSSPALRRVTMPLDLALTVATFMAAYWLRSFLLEDDPGDILSHIALAPAVVAIWVFLLPLCGAYRSPRATRPLHYAWSIVQTVGAGLALLLTLLFLFRIQYVSRLVVVLFGGLDLLALVTLRLGIVWYFRRLLAQGKNFRRILIIGSGNRAARLAETLGQRAEWGIQIVGYLDPDPERAWATAPGVPILGSTGDISVILRDHVIDEVIVAVPRGLLPDAEKVAKACEEEGVRISLMADVFDVHVARMTLVPFGPISLLAFEPVAQDEAHLTVKRFLDVLAALLALPFVLPLMALIALAVRLDSPGPVFFIQERVGLNKRRFRMLKFRTMVVGSEERQAELEHLNEAEGPIFKIARDPRITRVGHFLRRTSLDELPQILHVIRGEMSLVGPRPMSVRDVQLFDQGVQRKRFSVKPGLTCLWQISGRSLLPFSRWLELDLYYIEHWSLGLDFKILLRTIPAVLRGTGAR